ncbi:MAG TPA: hypothetical protein VL944_02195 [Candidatus Acidoferrum sp.]|nr:hypothetical protein [Candidatus Acidoferrum sp.]
MLREVRARTPHRAAIAGGPTDTPEVYNRIGGATLGFAIEPTATVTITPRYWDDENAFLRYSKSIEFPTVAAMGEDQPQRIIRSVAEFAGVEKGFELTSQSGTSYSKGGSGLGSSSVFTVTAVRAFLAASSEKFAADPLTTEEKIELAEISYHIERRRLGQTVGKQDHYTSIFGGLNFFEYQKGGTVQVTPINLSVENQVRIGDELHLFYVGGHRDAQTILKGQAKVVGDKIDVLQKIKGLAYEARDRILSGEIDAIGDILHRGWEQKKTLLGEISNEHIDKIYRRALGRGATGGRLVGAGAGGYLLVHIPPMNFRDVNTALREEGAEHRRFAVNYVGSTLEIQQEGGALGSMLRPNRVT